MYHQVSAGLFLLLCFLMWPAYLYGHTESLGSFYFGLLILYRVIDGLIIKRRFWHIADEKVSLCALLIAFLLSVGLLSLLILHSDTPE